MNIKTIPNYFNRVLLHNEFSYKPHFIYQDSHVLMTEM